MIEAQDQWRQGQVARNVHLRHTMSLRQFSDIILYIAAFLCLFRGTQMAFALPTAQDEFVVGRRIYPVIQLYALMALSMGYIILNPREIMAAVRQAGFLLSIFMLLIAVSVVASVDVGASSIGLFATLAMTLPPFFFYWRFGGLKSLEMLRVFSVFTIAVNLIYAVTFPHYAFMSGSLAGDMRGLFPHKNWFGSFISLAFVILVPTPGEKPFTRPWIAVRSFFTLLALYCLFAAHSSTAIIQTAIGMVAVFGADMLRKMPIGAARSAAIVATFFGICATALFGGMIAMSEVAAGMGKDLTFSGRSFIWEALAAHLLDKPFTGYGFGTMRIPAYITPMMVNVPFSVNSSHNTYLELLLSIGIPATILWILFSLGRLHGKIAQSAASRIEAAMLNRQAALILMVLIGSGSEAQRMLAPSSTWPVMLFAMPIWTMWRASQERAGQPQSPPDRNGRWTREPAR